MLTLTFQLDLLFEKLNQKLKVDLIKDLKICMYPYEC